MPAVNGNIMFRVITAILVPAMFFIGSAVIGNDKESRIRDHEISKDVISVNQKIADSMIAQTTINGQTNVVLERILVKLEQIEKNGN